MEDKAAAEILIRLMEKPVLSAKEKEAVRTAVGILSWSKLGESRIKNMAKAQKAKREAFGSGSNDFGRPKIVG